jgi:hypothetical protein
MNKPNRLATRLLRSFCPPHLLEEIEGDLLQKFERDVKTFGEKKAKRLLPIEKGFIGKPLVFAYSIMMP